MAFEKAPERRGAIQEKKMPDYIQNYLIFELEEMETNILLEDNYTDIKLDLNVHSIQIEEGTIDTHKLNSMRADKDASLSQRNAVSHDVTNRSRGKNSQFEKSLMTKHNIFSKIMSSPLDLEHEDSDCSYKQMSPMNSDHHSRARAPRLVVFDDNQEEDDELELLKPDYAEERNQTKERS